MPPIPTAPVVPATTTASTPPSGARRAAIVEAATALFAQRGARGTSIAMVAEQVGITDAGVLYHFRSKEALVLGVLQQYADDVEAAIEHLGVHGIELLRLVRWWGAGMEQRPEISSLLIFLTAEHLTDDAPARRALQASYRHLLDRYATAFAEAASAGDLRADLDPTHEASGLIAHLDGIRLQWFLTDRSFSMAESVQRYVDDTLERLAPAPRRRRTR